MLDWDARVQVSTHCITMLAFMQRAMRERSTAGQPLWPKPASTMLDTFYASREITAQVLVISLSADEDGWRMAARSRPGPPVLWLGGMDANQPP